MNEKARSISVKLGQSRQLFILVIFLSLFYYMALDFLKKWPLVLRLTFYFNIWFENSTVHIHFTEKSAFSSSQLLCIGGLAGNFFSQSLLYYLREERETIWILWVWRFGNGVMSSHLPSLPHWSFLQKLKQWLYSTPASLTTKAV